MMKTALLSIILFSAGAQAQYAKLPAEGPLPSFRPPITVEEEEAYVFSNTNEEDFYLNLLEKPLQINLESLHLGYHKTGTKKVYLSLDMIILADGKHIVLPLVQTDDKILSKRNRIKLKDTSLMLAQNSILKALIPYADSLDEDFKPKFFISLYQVGVLKAKTSPVLRTPLTPDARLYPMKGKVVDQVHNLGGNSYIYPEIKFSASFE